MWSTKVICGIFLLFGELVYLSSSEASSEEYLERESSRLDDAFVPSKWSSVRECTIRYYHVGSPSAVAPAFGMPTRREEFPHMAAIGWTQNNGSVIWNCGGSLISPSFVLTAGHCGYFDGVEPDLVRLGDHNLYSAEDDENVQQIEIAEFINHPNYMYPSRYYDLALVRLKREAIINTSAVVPACLWTNDHIHYIYKVFEATGWGQTSFQGEKTPELLKVQLTLVPNDECRLMYRRGYRLKDGIVDHQICAGDESKKMDTCPGDSGGPLEIKLVAGGREFPFIVGVTSFGQRCGNEVPGVYTRVSSFVDWIQNVTQTDFETLKCISKERVLRNPDPDIFSDGYLSPYLKRIQLNGENIESRVHIGWKNGSGINWNCVGIIIEYQYILSTASCILVIEKNLPSAIGFTENSRTMEIAAIFTHPLYERHSNDIAVIKLKERIEFSENTKPSCVWHDKRGDPYKTTEILGRGPYNLNDFFFTVYDEGYNYSTIATLSIRSSLYDLESCSKIYKPDEFWSKRVSNQHICYGFDRLYVPGVCESRLGEPSVRTYWEYGRHLWHTFGLSSYSRECGSGTPIIQSRMASHIDWIDSVIFGLGQNSGDGFHFNHSLKYKGDECQLPTGEQGLCKMDLECPEITRKFNSSEILCNFEGQNPIICCPNTWSPRPEVEEFFNRNLDKYEAFRPLPDSGKEDDRVFYRKPPKQDEAFAHTL